MNSQEIKIEIAKLENEAKQLLSNAHFINGAIQAYHRVLAVITQQEQAAMQEVKTEISTEKAAIKTEVDRALS